MYAIVLGLASLGLDRIDQKEIIQSGLDGEFRPGGNQGQGVGVYVFDTGVNCAHEDFEGRCSYAWDKDGKDAKDREGHGTHCAGTIAGGYFGVAKKAHIYSVKVLGDDGQ